MSARPDRREFLGRAALAGTGWWLVGNAQALPTRSPNERLNLAFIGVGGRGYDNLVGLSSQNVVALCDVDDGRAAKAYDRFPRAARYTDFRRLLDRGKDIDAVVISTPDHTHAAACLAALAHGKHVYCEKPLTHDIYEARAVRDASARLRVGTQMGNQGSALPGLRLAVEKVRGGAIGPVRRVHVWTNRPGTYWRQGQSTPHDRPPIPSTMHWDLWLGPTHPRPYHPAYAPFAWRGWVDFGTGALGDMGCHTLNFPFRALRLGYPESVEAKTSAPCGDSYPEWSVVTFRFPARDSLPPVELTWYDGGQRPPEGLVKGVKKLPPSGAVLVGERGVLYAPGDYARNSSILRGADRESIGSALRLPLEWNSHYTEWLQACRGGPPGASEFGFAAVMTETILLGNLAVRLGRRIDWDAAHARAVNCPAADGLIRRPYRTGWGVGAG